MQVRPPQLHLQRAMYTVSLEEGLWQAGKENHLNEKGEYPVKF